MVGGLIVMATSESTGQAHLQIVSCAHVEVRNFYRIQVNTAADYREPSRFQYDLIRKNKLPGFKRRHMLTTL